MDLHFTALSPGACPALHELQLLKLTRGQRTQKDA